MCRIWEGDALIVRKVRSVVFSLATVLYARYFGDNLCRTVISILEEGATLEWTRVATSGADGLLDRLEGVD